MLARLVASVLLLSAAPSVAVSGPATKLHGIGRGQFLYDPVALTLTSVGDFNGYSREKVQGQRGCCVTVTRTGSYVLTLKLADQFEIETSNVSYLFKKRGYRDSIATMSQRLVGMSLEVSDGGDPDFNLMSWSLPSGFMYEQDVVAYYYNETGQGFTRPRSDRWNPYSYSARNRFQFAPGQVSSDFELFTTRGQYFQWSAYVAPSVLQASLDNPFNGVVSEAFSVSGSWRLYNVAPEPATWAMLIVGFGAIGLTARRNRRLRVSSI